MQSRLTCSIQQRNHRRNTAEQIAHSAAVASTCDKPRCLSTLGHDRKARHTSVAHLHPFTGDLTSLHVNSTISSGRNKKSSAPVSAASSSEAASLPAMLDDDGRIGRRVAAIAHSHGGDVYEVSFLNHPSLLAISQHNQDL